MVMESDYPPIDRLEPREPTVEDLTNICREFNRLGVRYLVVGGFAMRVAGFARQTMDLDIIVAADKENEGPACQALEILPDQASRELQPGDLEQYTVLRIADEVVVDLMKSAGGIGYPEAATEAVVHQVDGVSIPFASPRLLWRMKFVTHREKDVLDPAFLRRWFAARGELPPSLGSWPWSVIGENTDVRHRTSAQRKE